MADSKASQRTAYPLAAYNFRVTVGDTAMSFVEVSGLVREYETLTYKHGLSFWEGESITKFRNDKYVPLTMRRGLFAGTNRLHDWLEAVEKTSLSVSLCDEHGSPVVTWRIRKAIVTKVEAPALQAESTAVAIETVTLMASGISVEHH